MDMKDYERKKRRRIKNLLMMDAAVFKLGPELMPAGEGTFNPATKWTFGTGWTNTTPTATHTGAGTNQLVYDTTGIITQGKKYKISFTVGGVFNGNASLDLLAFARIYKVKRTGIAIFYAKAFTNVNSINFKNENGSPNNFVGTITNVSIKEVL